MAWSLDLSQAEQDLVQFPSDLAQTVRERLGILALVTDLRLVPGIALVTSDPEGEIVHYVLALPLGVFTQVRYIVTWRIGREFDQVIAFFELDEENQKLVVKAVRLL